MNVKQKKTRIIISVVLIVAILVFYAGRLVSLQIVHGAEYAAEGDFVSVRNVTVEAARGEILDRNGNPIVTNRQGNSIILDAAYFPTGDNKAQNDIILALIQLFESRGETWDNDLPLVFGTDGSVTFAADRETDIDTMKGEDYLNLNAYATAQNCYDAMVEKFGLDGYSDADAHKIAAVRYGMMMVLFPNGVSTYTFAEDVSTTTASIVKENSETYQGADVQIVPYREYTSGTFAPHIIGRTAAIDADEYAAKKEEGYKITDEIGKFGLEQYAEDYLRGTDGTKRVTTKSTGEVEEEYITTPEQGNTVITTFDWGLQNAAQEALDASVQNLSNASAPSHYETKDLRFASGAAVVIDVNNGEILACASNPNYDITQYAKNYTELSKATNSPLWNRPLLSAYAPGSTFKPGMALAGLEEGVITRDSTIDCVNPYWRFTSGGVQFTCLQDQHRGATNVISALEHSCNIFFYETGYRLGIDKIDEYAAMYGFGQNTGVELPEEDGVISSPAYAEEMAEILGTDPDAAWTEGMIIQTAIGQAYNLMTPLQMANYCAMIANGGTRYVPHFIKSIKSYDYSETLVDNSTGTVAYQGDFDPENIAAVQDGMYAMATFSGNPASALNEGRLGEIGVAAKSGTPQLDRLIEETGKMETRNNGFLIAYAPYDDPEIAICVTIEDGYHSSYAVSVAKAILEAYFFGGTEEGSVETPLQTGVLLP